MPVPTSYQRSFSFTSAQAAAPGTPIPGIHVDSELDQVANALTSTNAALGLIQRSDGGLQNGIVTSASLAAGLLNSINATVAAATTKANAAAASAVTASQQVVLATQQAGTATSSAALSAAWASTPDGNDVPGAPAGSRSALAWAGRALSAVANVAIQNKIPLFASFTAMAALNLGLSVGMAFDTQGYATPGDGGGARYTIVNALPTTAHASLYSGTSNDGCKFAITKGDYRLEQFGGKGDCGGFFGTFNGTDNYPAICAYQELCNFDPEGAGLEFGGSILWLGNKWYFVSRGVDWNQRAHVRGTGGGMQDRYCGSAFCFPPNTGGHTFNDAGTKGGALVTGATTATGSIISDFRIYGGGVANPSALHGLWVRTRISATNITVGQFPGNDFYVSATHTGNGLTLGNANQCDFKNCFGFYAGMHSWCISGQDSNSSTYTNCGGVGPNLCTFYETGTLGNTFIGCTSNSYGATPVGQCVYNGYNYLLLDDTPGIGSATQPGTNPAIWYPDNLHIDSRGATWVPGMPSTQFQVAAPFMHCGGSTKSTIWGAYAEQGLSHAVSECIVGGNQANFTYFAGGPNNSIAISGSGRGVFLPANSAYGNEIVVAHNDIPFLGYIERVYNGKMTATAGFTRSFSSSGLDICYGFGDTVGNIFNTFTFLGSTTLETLGRAIPSPYVPTFVFGLGLGDLTNPVPASARRISMAVAPPATGTFAKGEFVFNKTPTIGSSPGWQCTTAGSITTNAWAAGSFSVGNLVLNGGTVYVCTTAGTSANGPTGSGTGITDGGTAVWASQVPFVFSPLPSIPIQASANYSGETIAPGTVGSIFNISVPGVVLGDKIVGSGFGPNTQGVRLNMWVSTTNQISYRFENPPGASSVTLPAGTVTANIQH